MIVQKYRSEAFMQSVFNTAVDGIIIINHEGIIHTINPSVTRLFQYTSEELIGKNIHVLMPAPHREKHDQYINRYLETGKARIIGIGREVEGKAKDGTLFPFRLSISEVRMDDNQVYFTGIVHDISEVKQVEKELRELNIELEAKVRERTEELSRAVNRLLTSNSDLEHEIGERRRTEHKLIQIQQELQHALIKEKELGDLKSRFLTLASNEFRTPLTTILSSAALIGRYEDETGQEKRVHHIERIHTAVRMLTGLLEDFLSVGRLEEGKVSTQFEIVNLPEKLAEWVLEFRETSWKKGDITFATDLNGEFLVSTDIRILQNIMLNLLSNAVKYSDEPISVSVHLGSRDQLLFISVKDSGIGIPKSDQIHLFERFFRATNVNHIQGTGLGLHIVREYAQLLGGTLAFESEMGSGSTFTLVLPSDGKENFPLKSTQAKSL